MSNVRTLSALRKQKVCSKRVIDIASVKVDIAGRGAKVSSAGNVSLS
jgi:hypothetical protein